MALLELSPAIKNSGCCCRLRGGRGGGGGGGGRRGGGGGEGTWNITHTRQKPFPNTCCHLRHIRTIGKRAVLQGGSASYDSFERCFLPSGQNFLQFCCLPSQTTWRHFFFKNILCSWDPPPPPPLFFRSPHKQCINHAFSSPFPSKKYI